MMTILITYVRPNSDITIPKQRLLNLVVSSKTKNLNYETLNQARSATIERFCTESETTPENIRDFVFTNISLLGRMTPAEFNQQTNSPKFA